MSRNQGDRIAADRPDTPALIGVTAQGSTTLTYGQLEAAVQSRAAQLAALVRPGQTVGLLGLNSPEWLVAFYAIQRAGAVPVPVSHKMPVETLGHVLRDAAVELVLADEQTRALVPSTGAALLDLGTPAPAASFTSVVPEPHDPAMILYTSGSTGRPKGVVLSQASHLWVIDQTARTVPPGSTRVLISAPLYHMNALTNSQRSLASGATIVLLPGFRPDVFVDAIVEHGVTELSGVPPMFAMLLQRPELLEGRDLSSVRGIYMGSAPAAPALFDQLRTVFPNAEILFGYGTTESGPVVFAPHADGLPTPDGSVGVANPAVELRLVDAAGRPVERHGVLEIRNPALLSGYHNRPDVPVPVTADGFHHTKDVFRVDEHGFYFFAGREDDMFTSGGENVYPRSVEQVLEAHPAVDQAVVVPVPDDVKGAKPVAFVTLRPGHRADEQELKAHALDHLEPYAHPRRVWVVAEIPLSSTNKADRAELTERAAGLLEGP
ncbi:class I adenylate-forming enzyme family protein [Georgenia sp. H159]|uniref:class I adenylate-forming enzyme family protein n=1 Tax=Georgenia sp. H159 TaxID=3076115 RepID=UPI002D78039D|nr:class I adenylate-forming enzyme family protein [Georgenia sp. H159]